MRMTPEQLASYTKNKGSLKRKPSIHAATQLPKPPTSIPEEILALQLRAFGITGFVRELAFHGQRKWRFDFAHEALRIAVEIEGGTASGQSRHSKGKGFEKDCEKYNTAAMEGWLLLRFTSSMVKKGQAVKTIQQAIAEKRA